MGGGYAVTWAFGHLVQLAMPDGYGVRGFVRDNLPIIPEMCIRDRICTERMALEPLDHARGSTSGQA